MTTIMLFGGRSDERHGSVASAQNIARNFTGMLAAVVSLDPILRRMQDASVRGRTVFIIDHDGHIAAAAAQWWSVSRDGRTYTFYLRPGLRFATGRRVSAADVVLE